MTYGFLSDVHGDLAGLEWALQSLQSADQIYFLGDVCGGPEAAACLQLMRQREVLCVPGNHDLWDFERNLLPPELGQYLVELPLSREFEDVLVVHSDYSQDQFGIHFPYIHSESDARRAFSQFSQRLIFFGHTHLSQIHRLKPDDTVSFQRAPQELMLDPDSRYLINVGQAGQVCCLLLEGIRLQYCFRA
ncbi:metallophosphoesterase [bacterium]|nr:metallophosphoesterase [bacterium]